MSEHTPEAREFNDEFDRLMNSDIICPVCLEEGEEFGAVDNQSAVGYARCPKGHVYILEEDTGGQFDD